MRLMTSALLSMKENYTAYGKAAQKFMEEIAVFLLVMFFVKELE